MRNTSVLCLQRVGLFFKTMSNSIDSYKGISLNVIPVCIIVPWFVLWLCLSLNWKAFFRRCTIKKVPLKISQVITEKHLCRSLIFNKVADWRPATLLKRRFRHSCSPVTFVNFLRTRFYRTCQVSCFYKLRVFLTAKCLAFSKWSKW